MSSLDKRKLAFAYLFKPPIFLSCIGHAELCCHTETFTSQLNQSPGTWCPRQMLSPWNYRHWAPQGPWGHLWISEMKKQTRRGHLVCPGPRASWRRLTRAWLLLQWPLKTASKPDTAIKRFQNSASKEHLSAWPWELQWAVPHMGRQQMRGSNFSLS